ncbi:Uncharacterised protein [Bordetella pertussis]|nr:Uncharacterised protein [Bordetella pertussis]
MTTENKTGYPARVEYLPGRGSGDIQLDLASLGGTVLALAPLWGAPFSDA